ncbi:hypothetical protein T01_14932 [Trichinella spiralis]|uniref:Uncharacterized protein n=1 Tax=Trichinella spiralis TaxID=6334 RepID=A0A0V1BBX1_TRISP|nr:hypothetical protein T01_14932 [Trichinella spiralis]
MKKRQEEIFFEEDALCSDYSSICDKPTQNHFPCILIYNRCFTYFLFLPTYIALSCLCCFAKNIHVQQNISTFCEWSMLRAMNDIVMDSFKAHCTVRLVLQWYKLPVKLAHCA